MYHMCIVCRDLVVVIEILLLYGQNGCCHYVFYICAIQHFDSIVSATENQTFNGYF